MHDVVQSNVAFAGPQLQQGQVTRAIFIRDACQACNSIGKPIPASCGYGTQVGEVLPTSSD
jgi:hypothetical protein